MSGEPGGNTVDIRDPFVINGVSRGAKFYLGKLVGGPRDPVGIALTGNGANAHWRFIGPIQKN